MTKTAVAARGGRARRRTDGACLALGVCLVALALLLPGVLAHGAPPPHEAAVRVLHDHNDDCGGDGVSANCRGTRDLIALDVREAWDAELGNVLVFRLIMDEGAAGVLTETVRFEVDGQTKEFTLRDGQGEGDIDRVGTPQELGDGTRFSIDATVSYDRLGVEIGDVLSGFEVEARRDGQGGDFMPGGYHGPSGTVQDPEQGTDPTSYRRPSLRLEGPGQYVTISVEPDPLVAEPGREALALLSVDNKLRREAQVLTFHVLGAENAEVRFHDPEAGDGGYNDTYQLEVRPNGQGLVHVSVFAQGPGNATITVTSDLGAHVTHVISYTPEGAPSTNTTTPDQDASGLAMAPVVLICAAWLARRR